MPSSFKTQSHSYIQVLVKCYQVLVNAQNNFAVISVDCRGRLC